MIPGQNCGNCAHSFPNSSAVGSRLGCWQERVASGFQYTFNLAHDGKDCDTFKPKPSPTTKEST